MKDVAVGGTGVDGGAGYGRIGNVAAAGACVSTGVRVPVGAKVLVAAVVCVGAALVLGAGVRVEVLAKVTVGAASGNLTRGVGVGTGLHAANSKKIKHIAAQLLEIRGRLLLHLLSIEHILKVSTNL